MTDSISIPATHLDLVERPGVAAFTTVGAGGYPQTTAIWFLLDRDGDREVIRTSLHRSRQKYRNVVRDHHATLFLIDPANPYHTLEIRGDVSFEDDDTSFLKRILAHYGRTLETFAAPTDNRVVLTLTPRRVVTNG